MTEPSAAVQIGPEARRLRWALVQVAAADLAARRPETVRHPGQVEQLEALAMLEWTNDAGTAGRKAG